MKASRYIKNIAATLGLAALVASCSGSKGWSVDGIIEGADGGKIALEAFNNGIWYVVDSLQLGKDGKFGYKSEVPAPMPEIFRLSLPSANGSIYFPVDSCDKLHVRADIADFAKGYSVSGTPAAESICRVDSLVAATVAAKGPADAASDSTLSRRLVQHIIADTTGIVAYYTVGKTIDGKPLFNYNDRFGNRVYGAAAQVFSLYRPDDVRGKMLKAQYFEGRQALGYITPSESRIVELPESGVIEIDRYDNQGKRQLLSEVSSKGNVTLLSFTAYGYENALPYNVILNEIYEKYHKQGLEIYQIAFDEDELQWKNVAVNLPWITVWNAPTDGSSVLVNYNVGALPMTFIIDKRGTIAERVVNPADLAKAVAKYM